MKLSTLLITTILTGSMINALPALAANNNNAMQASSSENTQLMQQDAAQIIGNINIAEIALTYGMNDDAMTHLNNARQEIAALHNNGAAYNSATPLTAGKMTVKTTKGTENYFIPVENDRFVVDTFDTKHLSSKAPDIDVTDAQTVHYKLLLDTKVVDDQLAKAQNAMMQKQYDVALSDLQGVSKGAITETVVENKPLDTVRDNLILSKELLHNKDYRGASYALKHASNELTTLETTHQGLSKDANIKNMQAQITDMQVTLAKDNPSDIKTAEMKIESWIKDVKEKISSKI